MQQKPQIKCKLCKKKCDAYDKFPCQKRQFCSKKCSTRHTAINRKGYKGGRIISPRGYRMILVTDHPSKNSRGYVFEHRLVVEKHLGRYLKRTEEVHHINGKKLDNRIENLQVLSGREHASLPKPPPKPIQCPCCKILLHPKRGVRTTKKYREAVKV